LSISNNVSCIDIKKKEVSAPTLYKKEATQLPNPFNTKAVQECSKRNVMYNYYTSINVSLIGTATI
jgi:hypothetical protein